MTRTLGAHGAGRSSVSAHIGPDRDALAQQLAGALPESLQPVGAGLRRWDGELTGYGRLLVDALLPVVVAYGDQRVREGKAEVWSLAASWVGPPFADEFRARAAALRTSSETAEDIGQYAPDQGRAEAGVADATEGHR